MYRKLTSEAPPTRAPRYSVPFPPHPQFDAPAGGKETNNVISD